jgi:hypothetical protein
MDIIIVVIAAVVMAAPILTLVNVPTVAVAMTMPLVKMMHN